jgi:hypothetical protein
MIRLEVAFIVLIWFSHSTTVARKSGPSSVLLARGIIVGTLAAVVLEVGSRRMGVVAVAVSVALEDEGVSSDSLGSSGNGGNGGSSSKRLAISGRLGSELWLAGNTGSLFQKDGSRLTFEFFSGVELLLQ